MIRITSSPRNEGDRGREAGRRMAADFRYEYLGRCAFEQGCEAPAVARVWRAEDRSDAVLVCQAHFDRLRGVLEELRDEQALQSDLTCPKCGAANVRVVVLEAGPHFRANCEACGAFVKFIGRKDLSRFRAISGKD